ncbi:hypothetical protein HOLleu_03725 [Holothuria leucospilota]|uniref:Uncharacterized protein n=1 Tax=Holothuria leucospilota TaxID=206669 RepID=A0A9Q1CTS5_HOLLE|nr:hypothetical protein HOLleu_03725 [Holothuria leucospilota]
MLIAFYQLSIDEIIDKMDEEDLRGGNITAEGKIKSTMRILTEKGYITSTNVTSLKNAFAGLGKLYVDRLHQPLDAYIKYAGKPVSLKDLTQSQLNPLTTL